MKKVLLGLFMAVVAVNAHAQRIADNLTRGLVAIPQGDKTGQDDLVAQRRLPAT